MRNPSSSGSKFGAGYRTHRIKRRKHEMPLQLFSPGYTVKVGPRPDDRSEWRPIISISDNDLAGGQAGQLRLERAGRNRCQFKMASGNICCGNPYRIANSRQRDKHIRRPAVEQAILSQGTRGHKADDIAGHQRFIGVEEA